jgi:hypothetical protein
MADSSHSEHTAPANGGAQKETDRLTVPHAMRGRTEGDAVLDILRQRDALEEKVAGEEMGEAERQIERMPAWVPQYLAAFGSRRPDGKRMTVKWAAELAGTNPENVRQYRKASAAFRRLEEVARFGDVMFMQSYVDAGLRGLAPLAMEALADLLRVRNPQVTLKAIGWLRGPEELAVTLQQAAEVTADDMAEAARRAAELEAELLDDEDEENPISVGDDNEADDWDEGGDDA